jgi:hypothetical protein
MPKGWPPREDRRQRRERQVTNANRVSTYGLTDEVQKRLRTMVLDAIMAEPAHPDNEIRMRHVGAEVARRIVQTVIIEGKDDTALIAIIDGVLATELRRFAQRVEREEFDQSTAPSARPIPQTPLFS